MTLILKDSCDSFDKWPFAGAPTIVAARNGNGFQVGGTTAQLTTAIATPFLSDTITVGFAWRRTDASTALRDILVTWDVTNGLQQTKLTYTPSSTTLAVTRDTTAIATNTGITFTQNTWYYIELQAKMHDTTGFAIVRVDGVERINATALDTKNGGGTVYSGLGLRSNVSGTTSQYDDIYLKTGAGETFDGDLGALTTTPTIGRVNRQSIRAGFLLPPGTPNTLTVARSALRVAIAPAPANTAVSAAHQMRVAVGLPPADTVISAGHQMRVAVQDATAKVRIGSVPAAVVALTP